MSQNVYEQVATEKPNLLERMSQNNLLADAVMGYLNLFIGISLQLGYPVDGVRIAPLVWCQGDIFRALVTFSRISSAMPRLWGTQSDFFRYAAAKANHMARALQMNPGFETFFEDLVGIMDQFARQKGCPFQDVQIVDPIITRDYVLTFKLRREVKLALH